MLRFPNRRWFEVEPLVFRGETSPDYMVFRQNDRGEIIELHEWGATYERIPWWEQAPFHVAILLLSTITFLAYASLRIFRALRGASTRSHGMWARGCATLVCVANLSFVIGLAIFIRRYGETTPLPLPILVWLSLPIMSLVGTVLLPVFAINAWKNGWWTRRERVSYSTVALFAIAFMIFLNYWKLLGIRY